MLKQLFHLTVLIFCVVPVAFGDSSRPIGFYDDTASTGIQFVHTDGSSGNYFLVETVTAGLGLFDYDNDGDLDIYFANGAALPGKTFDTPPTDALYRNDGNLKFTDVTKEAGVNETGYSMGCVMGDYDNDGDLDIYVSNFGPDVLYRNNGDGTFTDVTQLAGLGDPLLGAGAAFADFNKDGWLDLFVANYIECPMDKPRQCTILNVPLYCDPSTYDMYEPQQDCLYLNNGDGTFRNVTETCGIAGHLGRGMGVSCMDFDNDGDTDIYVANDVSENFLFTNNGDGTFEETALFAGIAYDTNGREQGSMGCDFGDYDNDGWFDLIVTSYQNQLTTLYRNSGGSVFDDVTIKTGISANSMDNVKWAVFFFDYDNDADPDVFIANGHLQDRIEEIKPGIRYEQTNHLFRNNGDGTFEDISKIAGPGFQLARSARGGAYGDLDNDGDLDIVISNSRKGPTVLVNESDPKNHWINIKLTGSRSNRDGIGARVTVKSGGKTQMNEVRAGSSYQSHYDLRLHFGLGETDTVDEITVQWPSGTLNKLVNQKADRFLTIKEE